MHKAMQAGLVTLQDRCLKIDHKAVAGGSRMAAVAA
jgi:predicted CoA-binding protein